MGGLWAAYVQLSQRNESLHIKQVILHSGHVASYAGRKDEKNSSLHKIPNLIVSIFALHDPSGSHTTMANILRRIRKRFPEIMHHSLEREFLRTLLNITYFGNLYHFRYSVPATSSRGMTSRMPFIQYYSVLLISWLYQTAFAVLTLRWVIEFVIS